jgi:hypothetical protein
VFARELPQLSPQRLADPACQGGLIRSKDAMESFFGHTLINVSNSLGPHCECAHAIRLPGSLPACLSGPECLTRLAPTCMNWVLYALDLISADIGGGLNHGNDRHT